MLWVKVAGMMIGQMLVGSPLASGAGALPAHIGTTVRTITRVHTMILGWEEILHGNQCLAPIALRRLSVG